MNPEIKTRWVTALRSGNYRQGTRKLAHKEDKADPMQHCCLGVLCELAVEDGIIEAVTIPDGPGLVRRFGGGEEGWSDGQLPLKVAEWAGFDSDSVGNACDPTLAEIPDAFYPEDSGDTYKVSCSEMNDGYDYRDIQPHTFGEIANLIEENF
jgi:hypothetical protein